jgi:hypothetical protein
MVKIRLVIIDRQINMHYAILRMCIFGQHVGWIVNFQQGLVLSGFLIDTKI